MNKISLLLTRTSPSVLPKRGFISSKPLCKQIKLVLYTKDNCSLCQEAKEFIEESYPEKFLIEEVDITKNNRELFRKFKLDIPVFYYNGQFLMQHKVDVDALEKLISKDQFD